MTTVAIKKSSPCQPLSSQFTGFRIGHRAERSRVGSQDTKNPVASKSIRETLVIHNQRLTAKLDGEFAVFMIGMRINQPWKIHKLIPVFRAMPRMLNELYANPELGLLSHEMWFSRTLILIQYWRSIDQLIDYAQRRDSLHLPAWQAFNKAVGTDGTVGIWHETYKAGPGSYENIYVNMPAFGLGRAGQLIEAKGSLKSAAARFNT